MVFDQQVMTAFLSLGFIRYYFVVLYKNARRLLLKYFVIENYRSMSRCVYFLYSIYAKGLGKH